MGINDVSVGKLDLEVRVRQCFKNNTLKLYYVVLRQKNPSSSIYDTFVFSLFALSKAFIDSCKIDDALVGECHRMLVVSGKRMVLCNDCPAVT